MKIRKILFFNHPVFGNTEFDFTDKNGKAVDTIIIAGENGVGKSLLLESIFEFSNYNLSAVKRNEQRIFEIEITKEDLEILKNHQNTKSSFALSFSATVFRISFDYNIINLWEQIGIQFKTNTGFSPPIHGSMFVHAETKKILKSIFSDVAINFSPKAIKTVTSTNLDKPNSVSEKSTSNLATEITQLLIDIQSLDALELNDWVRNHRKQIVEEDKIDVRIKRFTTAFDYIFTSKKYKGIENISDQKQIIFKEHDREMNINQLSSGEKQIVFRGGFLLKDKESSKGAVILIDEPEISLHPNWQLKILSFFKKLFTNEKGTQTSQIIISTHSPFIIHNANRIEDKVLVLKKDDFGKTVLLDQPKFLSWSVEKVVQDAFNISHIINDEGTTIFLEGETDEMYFRKAFEIFNFQDSKIKFSWIGRINDKGNAENTGDTALNQAKTFFLANLEHAKGKIILFYDSDTNKVNEDIKNVSVRCMSINNENSVFKIGVENLLTLEPNINPTLFYKEKIKKDNYGAESVIRELDKTKLCKYVCEELDVEIQKVILEKLRLEIEKIIQQNHH